jgi:hypothetical protein
VGILVNIYQISIFLNQNLLRIMELTIRNVCAFIVEGAIFMPNSFLCNSAGDKNCLG